MTTIRAAKELRSPKFQFNFPQAKKTFFFSVNIKLFEGELEFSLVNHNQQDIIMSAQTFDGIAYGTFADRILGLKK